MGKKHKILREFCAVPAQFLRGFCAVCGLKLGGEQRFKRGMSHDAPFALIPRGIGEGILLYGQVAPPAGMVGIALDIPIIV